MSGLRATPVALALALALLAGCPRPPGGAPSAVRPEPGPAERSARPERGADRSVRPERSAAEGGAESRSAESKGEPVAPHAELDVVGVVHVVGKGESLARIARAYGLTPEDLAEVNGVDPRSLAQGDELFVPGATRVVAVPPPPPGSPPEPAPKVARRPPEGAPPSRLAWPVRGVLYSPFGPRQGQPHDGIDISAPEGTVVTAAAAGRVVYAGRQAGYGSLVILRHDGGILTVYAHASKLLVREGDRVAAGAPVARVGMTGRTTGPHLHFEVREGTRPRDPMRFLPAG